MTDGIEASLDVLASRVKSGFLRQGYCSSIVTKDTHVQELHKHQIKNDEPGMYTYTITTDGKERGERQPGC